MADNVNNRISELIEKLRMNKNSFAVKAKIKPQTLHNIVEGRMNKPSFDIILKILTAFPDISEKWLIKGEGVAFEDKTTATKEINISNSLNYQSEIIANADKTAKAELENYKNEIQMLRDQIKKLERDKEFLMDLVKERKP